MYPLRFEPEQSVSLDLGWGEGRGGLDKGMCSCFVLDLSTQEQLIAKSLVFSI